MSTVKHIYLIRHGETKMNHGWRHQGPDEPLTERGREQVRALIKFLKDEQIDTLVASDYKRAQETAEAIGVGLDLPILTDPAFREFGRPLSLYGRHHLSPASFRYFFDLYRHRLDLLWDREGAENVAHVRERIKVARRALEDLPGQRIAVVSHRIFMTMFVETVCYDKPLSLLKFVFGLLGRKRIPNTGILHLTCQVPESDKQCNWFLEETLLPPYNRITKK